MIEVYSNNVEVGANASIPLNSVTIVKGITAVKDGNTIELNRCGVYSVHIDGYVTVPTGTTVTVQLRKDGVLQPQAIASLTAVADQILPFGFETLVQVSENNTPNPCSAPTVIDFVNTAEATFNHVNIVVTKLV